MDSEDELQLGSEFNSESTAAEHDPPQDQSPGVFFPKAQHFVVAGGNFQNITNITRTHVTPTIPSDFRRIPIGDLDFRNEIRLECGSGVAYHRRGQHSARRIYSARIHGSRAPMTVALYQGENAEQEWRQDISHNLWLRHPNFIQLYATASSYNIHAAIFHDELISAKQVLEKYRVSHFATVYLWGYLEEEFLDAWLYAQSVSNRSLDSWDCTMWIRPSTGRLCVELASNYSDKIYLYSIFSSPPSSTTLSFPEFPDDSKIIHSVLPDLYLEICFYNFRHYLKLSISMDVSVPLGAVIFCRPDSDGSSHPTEIARIPDMEIEDVGWKANRRQLSLVVESGWTRLHSSDILDGSAINRAFYCADGPLAKKAWLAQANHIFDRLGIASNHADYFVIHRVLYELKLSDAGATGIPSGYLFLCPLTDLHSDRPSLFQWPDCPAYWSFDPLGAERLSMEEAGRLGFPCFEFNREVRGYHFDESVYTGIRLFHEGRGFDPDSTELARELGYPLYYVSYQQEGLISPDQENDDDRKVEGYTSDTHPQSLVDQESEPDASLTLTTLSLDETEMIEPSRNWRIVMGAQFTLILMLTLICVYDLFFADY